MKIGIKYDLIDALRSGDHFQCQDLLEDNEGHQCCLGVLCDIMGVPRHIVDIPAFGGGEPRKEVHYGYGKDNYNWSDTELRENVCKRAGLNRADMNTLMGLNDDGFDFDFIADWIEVTQ